MSRDFKIVLVAVTAVVVVVAMLPLFVSGPNEGRPVVKVEVDTLRSAISSYSAEYGTLPGLKGSNYHEVNQYLTSVLTCVGGDAFISESNPRKIQFLFVPQTKLKEGVFCDPWGEPYRFGYASNVSPLSAENLICSSEIALWSVGKNRRDEGGHGDDVMACVSER